jgi:hypothetical protein
VLGSCPNPGWIRTRKGKKRLKLSETGVDSDSKREKGAVVVRNRGGFGQEKGKRGCSCPKPGWIRTVKGKKGLRLSETRVDSDRKREKGARLSETGVDSDRKREKLRNPGENDNFIYNTNFL